jgi:hypothetical protein
LESYGKRNLFVPKQGGRKRPASSGCVDDVNYKKMGQNRKGGEGSNGTDGDKCDVNSQPRWLAKLWSEKRRGSANQPGDRFGSKPCIRWWPWVACCGCPDFADNGVLRRLSLAIANIHSRYHARWMSRIRIPEVTKGLTVGSCQLNAVDDATGHLTKTSLFFRHLVNSCLQFFS